MLRSRAWKRKYTLEDGDLIGLFYVPALQSARRYDRLTGFFNAGALALAARGVEGLARNGGRMRLVTGCTLTQPEIEAISEGEQLRERVERHLAEVPLDPPDSTSSRALELLAWMVARGLLDVKVAVPCDGRGHPISDGSIFHEKAGIVEDLRGDRIAWNGSLNETATGWQNNWEGISVFTSWGSEPDRVTDEETNFENIWTNEATRLIVLDMPEAARRDLLRFMPRQDVPERLQREHGEPAEPPEPAPAPPAPDDSPEAIRRSRVWKFIREAPSFEAVGGRVGEATAAITPWPHQVRAFQRLYKAWPPKLLIADEVGLGKTIQAGLLLRQAKLAGQAKRILILAPKAVLRQWQIELREKFNLNWPIYDGGKLSRYPSKALEGQHERRVGPRAWHREPAVIVSSHLMRRKDRASVLLTEAEPWDLIVLDEAHHARRHGAGSAQEGGPNALLKLMQALKDRTQGLVLLTATPMQVDPVEVWDLLQLLGLPPEWTRSAYLEFFKDIANPHPSASALKNLARLFQAVERVFGQVNAAEAKRLAGDLSRLRTKRVLNALRDSASTPLRRLEAEELQAALRIMRANTPLGRLISRHTRALLRRYVQAGQLTARIADREVRDRFIDLTAGERALYESVEGYIASTYNQASDKERNAVGFVMTIYRRRLASSFRALRNTLQNHLEAITKQNARLLEGLDEDASDDELADENLDADDPAELQRQALAIEEAADIERLISRVRQLPADSKLATLRTVLEELRREGYRQVMVFTQYTDTMDFLRDELGQDSSRSLMCFSGRGGEVPFGDGGWNRINRDEAKRRFLNKEADVLLCTDAAAEGLNFQFCGALVNYDMPWNPMRVEQRIGRIDRLGQEYPAIKIVNLHYNDTVETDVYRALKGRISLFESVVGRLQPILSKLPRKLSKAVLAGPEAERAQMVDEITREVDEAERKDFDLDAATEADLAMPDRPASPVTMAALGRVIASPDLMPPGTEVRRLSGPSEYGLLAPGMQEALRVTTDPEYFQKNAESVELWSPENPLFQAPEGLSDVKLDPDVRTLDELLDSA